MAGILNPVRMYGLCVGSTDRTLLSSNRGGDAAASVAAALREFDRHKNPEDTVVLQFDYDEEGINSSTSVRESVEAFEQIVKPGDLFVFYVATHGTGGSNGVEIIGLNESGVGSQIYDWELTSWFDSDAWNEVNKLFILNTCHAGGFGYGNDGGAGTQDNLAGLPRSAILAACDEDGDTGSNWLTGFPSFTETVLDALQITDGYATADSNQNGLDFDELQAFVQAEVASKGSYDGYVMLHPASDDIPLETFSPTFYSWFSEDFELRAAGNFPLLGDVNLDGEVNGLDVDPFVDKLLNGPNQAEADMNVDGEVNGLDVDPFVAAVVGGGAQPIPEPSTLLLATLALLGLLTHAHRRCAA